MKMSIIFRLFLMTGCLTLLFAGSSCDKFKVNSRELKIMEGKWKVTSHRFTFFIGQYNEVTCDTSLDETGVFEFHRTNDYGGTFSFTPATENRPVTPGYSINPMSGTFELTDLKSSVVFYLFPEGGGMAYKYVQIVDFNKSDQVWYADISLNIESGANETIYLEKE